MSKHRYTKEMLAPIVEQCKTMAEVCLKLNLAPATGSQSHLKNRIIYFGLDISHFLKKPRNANSKTTKKSPDKILVSGYKIRPKSRQTTRAMLEKGVAYACVRCSNPGKWNGEPLTLEVDHINNNWADNQLSNVQFLCPNCHSQKTKQDDSRQKRKQTLRRTIDTNWRKRPRLHQRKVDRPSAEVLLSMVWQEPAYLVAKKFGVSDSALGKWCRDYGIEKPRRGYWAKRTAGKSHEESLGSNGASDRPRSCTGFDSSMSLNHCCMPTSSTDA